VRAKKSVQVLLKSSRPSTKDCIHFVPPRGSRSSLFVELYINDYVVDYLQDVPVWRLPAVPSLARAEQGD
jgi:hypothetical protein